MSVLENFEIPRSIELGENKYSYKDNLTKDCYSYRCKFRTTCKITIKIEKSQLKLYIENKSKQIEYTITSKDKNHTCKQNIKIDNNNNKIKKIKNVMVKSLILSNLDKPLSFHVSNLNNNEIFYTKNQIKWILQILSEELYPSNEKFLANMRDITISFDNSANLQNLPFCYKFVNLINPTKKNSVDKYIIFTSKFQINLITKCTQIFLDGTFKISPIGYFQILNISGYLKEINGLIPLFKIPTTGKTQYLYENILTNIKKILLDNNIKIENITKQFLMDFEPSLQNAVRKIFVNVKINGCFFHYVKILWDHSKRYGLCVKKEIKNVKILIFLLKLFPYMDIEERKRRGI